MDGTEDFINSIMDRDFNSAEGKFADLMNTRIQDALDQQKIQVAGNMFGEPNDEITDEITDEDWEESLEDEDEDEQLDFEFDEDELEDEETP